MNNTEYIKCSHNFCKCNVLNTDGFKFNSLDNFTDEYLKIFQALLSTNIYCIDCTHCNTKLICINSHIQLNKNNDKNISEDTESEEEYRKYEEYMEEKWMQADIDEYNKNKEIYDNFKEQMNASSYN